jgi:hypothetical protein
MSNFVIFFNGHEGSTAIISHLKKSQNINILWYEPFDNCHLKKKLEGNDLAILLDAVYKRDYIKASNIYKQYSDKPLDTFTKNNALGFKMRQRDWSDIQHVLVNNNVIVLVLFRNNILKWGLSKCESNHLQFKLVKNEISHNPKMTVNFELLTERLKICKKLINDKQQLLDNCKKYNIKAYPIYYETYCNDKIAFFDNIFKILNINIGENLKDFALQPIYFKKVHSDDLKQYITNYDELVNFAKKNDLSEFL